VSDNCGLIVTSSSSDDSSIANTKETGSRSFIVEILLPEPKSTTTGSNDAIKYFLFSTNTSTNIYMLPTSMQLKEEKETTYAFKRMQ
jgi:hypothetical protein